MPANRKPVLTPVAGLDYSKPSTFINDQNGFPKNMRYYKMEIGKRPGLTKYGSVAISGDQVMGLGKLELSTGVSYLVRTSKTKIEKYNTSTLVWDSISASDFTGGNDDHFFFTNVSEEGLLIVTNGFNQLRKWTGTGNTAALGGSPPKAKFVSYLSPYTFLAYTDDGTGFNPWNIQWSDTGNSEEWSDGNAGSALLGSEPSPIKNIMRLNEYMAVYKEHSLWLGQKVSTSDVFLFDLVLSGVGLAGSRCVAEREGYHYFMSHNDFLVWNGVRPTSIGDPVREEVFSKINRQRFDRCFALHVQELTEIWFYIVVVGQDWPTEIWKYNYKTGFWYMDTCNALTCALKWAKVSTESWDDDTGTWDSDLTTWDEGSSAQDWEEVIQGRDDGYTLKLDYSSVDDDGTAISGEWQSKDFTADYLEFHKRWLQLDIWARGYGSLKAYYSTDYGSSWTYITTLTLSAACQKFETYLDTVSDTIRFKLISDALGETFYLRNLYPYYLRREEKRS